jgi:hypothetical protein
MPRRADVLVSSGLVAAQYTGAGTNYIVQTPTGVLYAVYIDHLNGVTWRKSSDGGLTWTTGEVVYNSQAVTNLAVWYDRWSNISAGLIHMVYTNSGDDDTHYRTLNTESSDALSTQTVIFAGASTLAGGHLSVTRAVGGNVYCKTVIDAGSEGAFHRLVNANVPNGAWGVARTVDEVIATLDQMILLPDFDAADTQDIMAIFQDASVTETSRKLYDDSANSWSETSIDATITELSAATAFANFSAAPDIANTRHVLVVWSATDAASQDLRCWTVDSGAITAKTDVVANATDDCGLCAVTIDTITGWWWVFYGGKSDGSETWGTATHIYYKVSQDTGTTWGAETLLDAGAAGPLKHLIACPRILFPISMPLAAWVMDGNTSRDLRMSVDRTQPRATYVAGVF